MSITYYLGIGVCNTFWFISKIGNVTDMLFSAFIYATTLIFLIGIMMGVIEK